VKKITSKLKTCGRPTCDCFSIIRLTFCHVIRASVSIWEITGDNFSITVRFRIGVLHNVSTALVSLYNSVELHVTDYNIVSLDLKLWYMFMLS